MTEPITPADPSNHAAHDPTWMAALATRDPDLRPAALAHAQAALHACGACADLFADLVAVSAAIPAAATPARPRDFSLTAADAARLRPRGLRRWLSGIGSVRDGITFPLAMGLTTVGIAGLLVATVPVGLSGGTAGAAPEILSTVGQAVPQPAASAAAASNVPVAAASAASAAPGAGEPDDLYGLSPEPSLETTSEGAFTGDGGETATDGALRQDAADMRADASIRDDSTGRSALIVLAVTLLVGGLGLFALRWSARRL